MSHLHPLPAIPNPPLHRLLAHAPPQPPVSAYSAPRRRRLWIWFVVGGALVLGFLVIASVLLYSVARSFGSSADGFSAIGDDNIGVIDIDGDILSAETTVDQLRKFDQDSSIKAIILHIDSPGGAAAPSQEIYHEVLNVRDEKKKPIVASIETVGASRRLLHRLRMPTKSTPTTPPSSAPSASSWNGPTTATS